MSTAFPRSPRPALRVPHEHLHLCALLPSECVPAWFSFSHPMVRPQLPLVEEADRFTLLMLSEPENLLKEKQRGE